MASNINSYDFKGKKAIVRVDFNVPIQDGKITDDTRIRGALPTLKLILEKGGSLIIMSHMGKPKGKVKPELSLSQIVDAARSLAFLYSSLLTARRLTSRLLLSNRARCFCLRTSVSILKRKASL